MNLITIITSIGIAIGSLFGIHSGVQAPGASITTVPLTKNGTAEYITYSADKLGVGTTTPSAVLTVGGTTNSVLVKPSTGGTNFFQVLCADGDIGNTGAILIGASFRCSGSNFSNSWITNNNSVGLSGNFLGIGTVAEIGFSTDGSWNSAEDVGFSRIAAGIVGVGNSTAGNASSTLVANKIGVGTTTPGSTLTVAGDFQLASTSALVTASISGTITGIGCDSANTSVPAGAVISSSTTFVTTPQTYPGDGLNWFSYALTASTIRTEVCSDVTVTPTASTYNVRIIK